MQRRDSPALAGALLECAEQYVEAVGILANGRGGRSAEPVCLIARHGAELALQAYLCHSGSSQDELTDARHDLLCLWESAHAKGLAIEASPPYWVQVINFAFDRPFLTPARVGQPPGAVPAPQALKESLDDLLSITADAIYRTA
jgi:hypothetical protein